MFSSEVIFTFLTLSLLEVVLGIDNLIFIALVVQDLPARYNKSARIIGLSLAFLIRIIMLLSASWVMSLTKPIFSVLSAKDILLLIGGGFLAINGSIELIADFKQIEKQKNIKIANSFITAILQIAFIDFLFSFDSILTAIGLTLNIPVIIAAIGVSMFAMLFTANSLAAFLKKYPNYKIIGIGFIILVGFALIFEGLHIHFDKNYLYAVLLAAIAFETFRSLRAK